MATDPGGLTDTEVVTIYVENANEAPVITPLMSDKNIFDATDPYLNDTIATNLDTTDYWTENNQYVQFDLPALTGQVHAWNQTPDEYDANGEGDRPFDMIIGILDKTNNIIIEEGDDGGSPDPTDYTDSEAIAIASDTSGRSDVDTFLTFNADDYPGADLAVLVGDYGQSDTDAFPTDGGAFNVFAVNDVGGASEDVVLAEYGSSSGSAALTYDENLRIFHESDL